MGRKVNLAAMVVGALAFLSGIQSGLLVGLIGGVVFGGLTWVVPNLVGGWLRGDENVLKKTPPEDVAD